MIRPTGEVARLIKDFVAIRMIQTNGMDLNLFQFDYDMSFSITFLNPDKTIYGRYGTRTQRAADDPSSEISMAGLARSMEAVLAIHRSPEKYTNALANKTGPPAAFPTPEKIPALKKYQPEIHYGPNVSKSCIHCHQLNDVDHLTYWDAKKPIPDDSLFLYPMPSVIGLKIDRETRATVSEVTPNSLAAKAGFQKGDSIGALNKQPIVSVADLQWVLHNTSAEGAMLSFTKTSSQGIKSSPEIQLKADWKKRVDISWRVSTWPLRGMVLGGIFPQSMSESEKRKHGLVGKLGLNVKGAGKYGKHGVARKAGVRPGDIIVGYDGVTQDWSETQLITYAVQEKRKGDKVAIKLLREGKPFEVKLTLQ